MMSETNVYQKFIIETDDEFGDCLIIGKCTYHKQLSTVKNKVKGGGLWVLDRENNTFTLYGKSQDFGKAHIEDIIDCIKRKRVYTSRALTICLSDKYNFKYRTDSGEEYNLMISI